MPIQSPQFRIQGPTTLKKVWFLTSRYCMNCKLRADDTSLQTSSMSFIRKLGEIQSLYASTQAPPRSQAAVLTSMNRSQDIPQVYKAVEENLQTAPVSDQVSEKTQVLMRMREAIFKTFVLIGYPKVIGALQALSTTIPPNVKLPTSPIRREESWQDVKSQIERGQQLFNVIYDRHSERVMKHLNTAYPDLAQTAINHLYGPVISETSIISAKETSLVMVATLMTQDAPQQLKSHRYGALHNGATEEDLKRIENLIRILKENHDE